MRGTRGTPKKSEDWRERFLRAFAATGAVKYACEAAHVGRSTVYRERAANEDFALAWTEVEEGITDELEEEAIRRAKNGSDTLLIFLMKCRRPERFQDRARMEITGRDGGPIEIAPVEVPDTDTYRQRVAQIAGHAMGELPAETANGSSNGHR